MQSNDYTPTNYIRIILEYDGYTAFLSKNKDSNSWLLTGWENEETGSNAIEEGNDSFDATATTPTRTRHSGDEPVPGSSISTSSENVNTFDEKNLENEKKPEENASKGPFSDEGREFLGAEDTEENRRAFREGKSAPHLSVTVPSLPLKGKPTK